MTDTNVTAETLAETTLPVDGITDIDAIAPEVSADDDNAEKPKVETKTETKADEAKTDDAGDKDGEEVKPKKLSGAARQKIREARLLSELSAREAEVEALKRQVQTNAGAKDSNEPPKEEDFNGDYFAYQRALTAHEVRQALREENSKVEQSKAALQQNEIARERAVAHAERVEDARDVIADFDEVMGTMKGVNVRNEVIEEIMSSDKSALLAYHLAKNPDKLQALNNMSARELAREMGRLEGSVRMPAAKTQTTAPPPLSAVKGGASPSSAESDLAKWLAKTYPK